MNYIKHQLSNDEDPSNQSLSNRQLFPKEINKQNGNLNQIQFNYKEKLKSNVSPMVNQNKFQISSFLNLKDKKKSTNRSISIRNENSNVSSTQQSSVYQSQAKNKSQSLQSSKEQMETKAQQDQIYPVNIDEKFKKFIPKTKHSEDAVQRTSIRPLAELVQEALQNKSVEERMRSGGKKKIHSSRSSVSVPKVSEYVQEYSNQQLIQLLPKTLKVRDDINQQYLSNNQGFDIAASTESVKQQIKERRRIGTQQKQSRSSVQYYQKAVPTYNDELIIPRAKRLPFSHEQDIIIEEQSLKDRAQDFNDGIRIKINKEKKIVNHLSKNHENTNLLFYNFNSFTDQSQNNSNGERVPTRGGIKSRKEIRESQAARNEQNVAFTLSNGFKKKKFNNQSGQSTVDDSLAYINLGTQDQTPNKQPKYEQRGDVHNSTRVALQMINERESSQNRQSRQQNEQLSSVRSSSCTQNQKLITNSKIRRGKNILKIAKIRVKSVADEILEEMSGGEEDFA